MRNFRSGYKNHNSSSNFSRNDRRNDRGDNRYQSSDDYRKPANKGFNRNFTDNSINKRSRRDYDVRNQSERHSFNQDRRDDHGGNRSSYRGNDRSFNDRSFRDQSKSDRSYRNQSPPRSRDREGHSQAGFNRSNDSRVRRSFSPPSSSKFRRQNDFEPAKNRPSRGRVLPTRRGSARTGAVSRIVRGRNDLRSGLIAKRTAPAVRSKEYAKKIRQARMRLNENESNKKSTDSKSPAKEKPEESKNEDNDGDFLDMHTDVNFEEDDDEPADKTVVKPKEDDAIEDAKEEIQSGETKTKTSEADIAVEPSKDSDKEKSVASKRSLSKEKDKDKDKKKSDIIFDLTCIHCTTKCMTVQDYRNHLNRSTHLIAMRKVSIKLKMKLGRLRKIQRDRQLEIEARLKNVEKIPSKYCPICKLYFRQSKIEHRDSEDHKKIRNFLRPYCKICRIQLPMPMKYEIHRCSIDHLKGKAKTQETSDDEIDLNDLDIGDFKTVDSIGDVDGGVETDADDEEFENGGENVGRDFINKIEVHYCSLCREYLSRRVEEEKSIVEHCKSKKHLKWYYQCRKKEEKHPHSSNQKGSEKENAKEETLTSIAENGKNTKKNSDDKMETSEMIESTQDVKRDSDVITLNETDDIISQDDIKEEKETKKFTRYYEVAN